MAKKGLKKKKKENITSNSSQIIYLDASIICGYLWGDLDRYDNAREIIASLKSRLRMGNTTIVKMSQLAVGEVINKINTLEDQDLEIYRKRHGFYKNEKTENELKSCIIEDFLQLLIELKIETPPLPPDTLSAAQIVQEKDKGYNVKGNDLFILSHSLADREADLLLTTDERLTDDRTVEMVLEICKNELEREKLLRIDDRL